MACAIATRRASVVGSGSINRSRMAIIGAESFSRKSKMITLCRVSMQLTDNRKPRVLFHGTFEGEGAVFVPGEAEFFRDGECGWSFKGVVVGVDDRGVVGLVHPEHADEAFERYIMKRERPIAS